MAANRKQEDFLFVYGTLRKAAANKMYEIISRNARPAGKASLHGRLYDLGFYPGAILSQNPADLVVGELYALDPKRGDETLEALDKYEGTTGQGSPEYRRERRFVTLQDGTRVKAWIYLYCQTPPKARLIPSGDYLAHRRSRATAFRGARKRRSKK